MESVSERKILQAKLYNDPLLFARYILPHHFSLNPAPFHREIYNQLVQKKQKNVVVAPRGHAKSTVITLSYALYSIVFCEASFIVILSDTLTQAKLFLEAVKSELEGNDRLKEIFGEFVGDRWGEESITTSNDIRVVCKGAGQKMRGLKYKNHRPDLVIIDDLENDELVDSPDRRKKLANWFFKAVEPMMSKETGRMVMIGTILHYDSLLNKLAKDKNYNPLFYRAIMNGEALWKEQYSLQDLEDIKQRYKAQGQIDTFFQEYMNEPISNENAEFKKEYFRYYEDDEVLIKSLSKFITVDLAISEKETADYTVIMVSGIDAIGNMYVLEYIRDRLTPIETIEWIFNMEAKWKPHITGVESVAYQRSLIWFLQDEMKRRNRYFKVEELKADTDKERRIRGMQPRYALGTVYHKAHMTELEEELLLFPKSPHDDLSDALAYVPQIAFPGKGREDSRLKEFKFYKQTKPSLGMADF